VLIFNKNFDWFGNYCEENEVLQGFGAVAQPKVRFEN
jgi:hypothetical protein